MWPSIKYVTILGGRLWRESVMEVCGRSDNLLEANRNSLSSYDRICWEVEVYLTYSKKKLEFNLFNLYLFIQKYFESEAWYIYVKLN